MDLLLTRTYGADGCEILKQNSDMLNLPIIIMSAHPNGASEAKAAGADGFLQKPLEIKDLINIIKSHLHQKNTI
jgi:DNA-binding response OmpR family regulator